MSDPGLSWDVFVAPSKPVVTSDLPSYLPKRMWSPVSATLIHGKHDAVLVDPLMTVEESRAIQLDRCDQEFDDHLHHARPWRPQLRHRHPSRTLSRCASHRDLSSRWGSSLDREITGSLVSTLADRLGSQQVAVAPWRSAILSGAGANYRAAVSISRFDGSGQSVVLQGRWELIAESGEEASLGMREISVTEKTTVMTPWSPRCRGRSSGSVRRWPTPSRQRRRWREAP
jgi:hypothetical protein